jgi:gas vesicle protein
MSDGNRRGDNQDNDYGGGGFMVGLLAGTVLGAGLGMLLASKAGSELRRDLADQAATLKNNASKTYRDAAEGAASWAAKAQETAGDLTSKASQVAGDWAERGKAAYETARDAAAKGAQEADRYVREVSSSVAASTPDGDSSASRNPPGNPLGGTGSFRS